MGERARPHCLVALETIAAFMQRAKATPPGAFVEVGVYHGGTAWHIAAAAEEQHRPCYLYDTFSGIPHKAACDSHQVGDFNDTSAELVRECIPYATVVEGVFPASALEMGPVAFVHLDVDQYQSYQEALEYFDSRMVPGGVIWCDDVPCLEGAAKALSEFVARHNRTLGWAEKAYIQF